MPNDQSSSEISGEGQAREVCECPKCGRSHWKMPFTPIGGTSAFDDLVTGLEAMIAEWEKMTRYGSPLAKAANENLQRARAALAKAKAP